MDFSLKNLIPRFDVRYLTSLSILVFAVGGCEKISPYVNKVENPSKGFPREYRFVKSHGVAMFFGAWCFAVTAASCILGMYDADPFTFALNVVTPLVLTALGVILPIIAKHEKR